MKYKELYDDEFLNTFGKHKTNVGNIKLKGFAIDVDKVANVCGIKLDDPHEIYEPKAQYLKAFQLFSILMHHDEISEGFEDKPYYQTVKNMQTNAANQKASQLLVPNKLAKAAIIDTLNELNYPEDKQFDEFELEQLILRTAEKMKLSPIKFRRYCYEINAFNDAPADK